MSQHCPQSRFLPLKELDPPRFLHPPIQLPVEERMYAAHRLGHQALFQALCTHSPCQPEEIQDMIIPILQGGKRFCSFLFLCSLSLHLGDTAETWELRSKPGSSKSRSEFITTLAGCNPLSYGEHPLVGTAGIPQTQGEHSRQQLGTSDTQARESQGHSNSTCGRSTSLRARAWSSLCAFLPERLLVPGR